MKNLKVSQGIVEKLRKDHSVDLGEVRQCFYNRCGKLLLDTRIEHQTNPPTLWFIAQTNHNRLLKIVYIQKGDQVQLKSAFEPNAEEIRIYRRYGGPISE